MSGKYSCVLLAAALLATANGRGTTISFLPADIHQPEGVHYFAGIPWMMIPGDEGVSHLAIFAETSPPVTRDARDIADDVIFNLYTNSRGASTPYTLRVNDTENLRKSGFDPTIPTKILVHGFAGDGDSANIINSKDAYLAKGNYNIIGVDWSVLCPSPNYIAAARNAVLTGELTAQLVEFLVAEAGARLQDVHIIGHSLGAQVAGFAGNSTITGKVARITGLDAAYPLFGNAEPAGRLDAGDAILVDTIHTCGGSVGFREPYGHVDFFPNGGDSPQPGCDGEITGECSHSRSHQYFTQSIRVEDAYPAVLCQSLEEAESETCAGPAKARMGDAIEFEEHGLYYVPVTNMKEFNVLQH
ncbi:pancreatic lipase-related protein 2 [Cryptotermes secundus]|uniref:pancreatic lipase-related protein 2 n=1 Tax=Cryptotermes secundus TaxID=105785 RepID=UPI000CD7DDEC|nr:pancreatic lipase-related protein 2 [Cryptotermes secundus]